MSIQAVAWALEQDLPARPKLVLVSIANHASHVDGYCWLKAETIAREAACTTRSIYRFIGGLVRNGFIRKAPKKGEDGKQRANDYWILFDREEKDWDWGASLDEDEADGESIDDASAEGEPQDVVEPSDRISHGEAPEPDDSGVTRQAAEMHTVSPGPCDSTFTRKRIAEPSESNPKASSAGARVRDVALRAYRPPPPQPVGADTEEKINPVFVYEGSRAYEAWAIVKTRERGLQFRADGSPTWHLTTRKQIEGRWKTGWYFPTLFPPQAQPPPETESSNNQTLCTEDDMKQKL